VNIAIFMVVGCSTIIAFLCLRKVWRSTKSVVKRVAWSLLLFVPVFGPILFAGLFEPPPVKARSQQPEFDPSSRGWK
jgi:Na+-driven multidrug efflux pump